MHREHARPARIPLPDTVDVRFAVCFRPRGGALRPEDLVGEVMRWLTYYSGRKPVHEAVRRHIEAGGLDLEVHSSTPLPDLPPCLRDSLDQDETRARRFHEATHCVIVRSVDRLSRPRAGLWAGLIAGLVLSRLLEGVLFDLETISFPERLTGLADIPAAGEIAMVRHIVLASSVDEWGRGWVTTMGMAKFGLPNLELKRVPPDLCVRVTPVVNAAAQHLASRVMDVADGCSGSPAELVVGPQITLGRDELRRAHGCGADAFEQAQSAVLRLRYDGRWRGFRVPFITLSPPAGFEGGHGVWVHEVVRGLLGSEEEVVRVADCALDAAHARAVARLPEVKERFRRGLGLARSLLVKRVFREGETREAMWVAVNTWDGKRLQGQLTNVPRFVAGLRAGDPIELHESEIFDWMILCGDERCEGGYTEDELMKGR